jgi:hypothetical protein
MREREPAKPPDKIFLVNLAVVVSVFFGEKAFFILSLNAKLRACVGKYLTQLATLPLQNDAKPSFWRVFVVQSAIPLYGSSRVPLASIAF